MAADHRSSVEVRPGELALTLRVVEIGERKVGDRLIDPFGDGFQDLAADVLAGNGHGEELPVGLGIQVPAVKWEAILLTHVVVPNRLSLVYMAGHEASLVRVRGMGMEGSLFGAGRCVWRGIAALQMEAQQCIGVQIVDGRPRSVPVVSELRVCLVSRHAQLLPLGDVGICDVLYRW